MKTVLRSPLPFLAVVSYQTASTVFQSRLVHCSDNNNNSPSANKGPSQVTLYQFKTCPFCCRVKAVMDYNGRSYETVEVDPLMKGQIKKFGKEFNKVPIVEFKSQTGTETVLSGSYSIIKSVSLNADDPLLTEDSEKWAGNIRCYKRTTAFVIF